MTTTLYHGTENKNPFDAVDLRQGASQYSSRANFGPGFYMTPDVNRAKVYAGHGVDSDPKSKGGIIYRIDVPENVDERIYKSHPPGWIVAGGIDVDQKLIDDVAKGMRKLGHDPVSGHDFAKEADKLEAGWRAGHYKNDNGMDFIKKMQNMYDVPTKDNVGAKTATDVFRASGIKGMIHSSAVILYDPQAVENPRIHTFTSRSSPDANTVGGLLEKMNAGQPLPDAQDRALRKQIVDAALATENKSPQAYSKFQEARTSLQTSGLSISPELAQQLNLAEQAAAKASGLDPNRIQQDIKTRNQIEARPPRTTGEGLQDYQTRVYSWYDKTNPGAKPEDAAAFNKGFHDSLYREAIVYHAKKYDDPLGLRGDAAKIDKMVQDAGHNGNRLSTPTLNYFEDEMGRYHSSPEFKASVKVGLGHAGQAGKATLPGMLMAGGTAAIIAGTMAAKGASAAEIGKEVKEQLTPEVVKHAAKGDSAKVVAEIGGGVMAGVTGGALGGAAAGVVCGPAAPVCSTVGVVIGGAAGAIGLHEPAKKGIETAILEARKGVEWALEKLDPGAPERQRKLDELLGSNVVGRLGSIGPKPEAAPASPAPPLKEDLALKP